MGIFPTFQNALLLPFHANPRSRGVGGGGWVGLAWETDLSVRFRLVMQTREFSGGSGAHYMPSHHVNVLPDSGTLKAETLHLSTGNSFGPLIWGNNQILLL